MNTIKTLAPWKVEEYYWGSTVSHRAGKVSKIFLKPNGIEIDCTNLKVIIHDNGIEFEENCE